MSEIGLELIGVVFANIELRKTVFLDTHDCVLVVVELSPLIGCTLAYSTNEAGLRRTMMMTGLV